MRPAADLKRVEDEYVLLGRAHLLGDYRLEVLVGELYLPVGEILEPRARSVEVLLRELVAPLLERGGGRVPPAVLAEHEAVALQADLQRVHDLVGRAVHEHAVLMDLAHGTTLGV